VEGISCKYDLCMEEFGGFASVPTGGYLNGAISTLRGFSYGFESRRYSPPNLRSDHTPIPHALGMGGFGIGSEKEENK
jgi:hypothetical protein